jgi:hypothetical protein
VKTLLKPACLAVALLAVLGACKRETPTSAPSPADTGSATAPAAEDIATPAVELKDIIETNERYVIGVSYPPALNKYPGLAKVLADYSEAARSEVMDAVEGLGNDKPSAPYELSLSYQLLLETPQLVAVAADGSSYTGGAHGQPLVRRFVWLPQQQKLLTVDALLPTAEGFIAVSNYAREQLHTAVSLRVEADDLPPIERAQMVKTADKMIDEGTQPDASNFGQFQPLLGADGKIRALRFVFPPYQVGPYSDGTQSVDVPASVLLPHVAPEYADLFVK